MTIVSILSRGLFEALYVYIYIYICKYGRSIIGVILMGILGLQTIAHIQVNEFLFLIACGYSVIVTQLLTKLATG